MHIQNRKSFSLIELLVAISIFSIIIIVIYSSFYTGILAHRKIGSTSRIYQNCRVTIDRLAQDLENSFPHSNEDSGFQGDSQQIQFFSLIPRFYDEFGNQTQVFKVRYQLSNGVLIRTLYPVYDEGELKQQQLLSNIAELKFSYSFSIEQEPFYEWIDTWQIQEGIPQGVKIDFELIDANSKKSYQFSRIVFIPQGVLGES